MISGVKSGRSAMANDRGGTILVALMVMAVLSLLGISALDMSDTELQIARNQELASRAFFLAEAGIQHVGGVLARDGFDEAEDLDGASLSFPPGSGGEYSLNVEKDGSVLKVTSQGILFKGSPREVTRTLRAEFDRTATTHGPPGAVAVLGTSPRISAGGNSKVSGTDHAPPEWGCKGKCEGSVLDDSPAQPGLYTSDDPKGYLPSGHISGDPPHQKGTPSLSQSQWEDFARELIMDRETVSNPSGNFGSPQSPQVTYINNATNLSGNRRGAGILIIEAMKFDFSGTFDFEGLIIILGPRDSNSGLSLTFTGTSKIFGSVLVLDDNANVSFSGTTDILYSSPALDRIRNRFRQTTRTALVSWADSGLLTASGPGHD